MTPNPFDAFNMAGNDMGDDPSGIGSSHNDRDDLDIGRNKEIKLARDESDYEVIEDANETTSFLASKKPTHFYKIIYSKGGGGSGSGGRAYMSAGR